MEFSDIYLSDHMVYLSPLATYTNVYATSFFRMLKFQFFEQFPVYHLSYPIESITIISDGGVFSRIKVDN